MSRIKLVVALIFIHPRVVADFPVAGSGAERSRVLERPTMRTAVRFPLLDDGPDSQMEADPRFLDLVQVGPSSVGAAPAGVLIVGPQPLPPHPAAVFSAGVPA
jgi:hypothetical protein